MRKKRLVIFVCSLGKGGAEKVVSSLLFCLRYKFEVFLALLDNDIVYPIPEGVKLDIIGFSPVAYKKYCKQNKIDISLSLLTKPNFISIASKLLGNKTKIVVSEHTNTLVWYSIIMQKIISVLYKRADKVITVSKKIAYNLDKYLDVANTKVIYNPSDINFINQQEVVNDKIDFISVGTLYDVKNHSLLIEAFSEIENKDSNLYILGDGPLKKSLNSIIKKYNLDNRVFLLGFRDNPNNYMKKAAIFMLTSNNEGLPNVLVEALATECAVISTDCISGPREILAPDTDFNYQVKDQIEYATYGVLVPVKNKKLLVKAMDNIDVDLYKSKALCRAKDFDIEEQCQKYTNLLNSL